MSFSNTASVEKADNLASVKGECLLQKDLKMIDDRDLCNL